MSLKDRSERRKAPDPCYMATWLNIKVVKKIYNCIFNKKNLRKSELGVYEKVLGVSKRRYKLGLFPPVPSK